MLSDGLRESVEVEQPLGLWTCRGSFGCVTRGEDQWVGRGGGRCLAVAAELTFEAWRSLADKLAEDLGALQRCIARQGFCNACVCVLN